MKQKLKLILPLSLGILAPFYFRMLWDSLSWATDGFARGSLFMVIAFLVGIVSALILANEL